MENLQKLHPRAAWLFFIRYLWGILFFSIFFSFWTAPFFAFFNVVKKSGQPYVFEGAQGLMVLWFSALGRFILIFAVLAIIAFIWAHLSYRFYRYQLTDIALKIEKGVIHKKYISIPFERIQNVDIYRTLTERILGLSDIQVQTAGYSGAILTEGRLPGLDPKIAENLREELIKRLQGKKQGL